MFKGVHRFFHHHYRTRYHGIYRHAKQLFVFDLALLALALVMLGSSLFFFLWKPGLADQIDLSIALGDERIQSGELVRLTVDYTNRSKFALADAILALHLPPGFVVDRARTPEAIFSNNSTFNMKTLEPGAKGQVDLFGRLWTTPRSPEKIFAVLSYHPEHTERSEQKITETIVSLSASIIQARLAVPTTAFPNRPTPFTLKLINTSDEKITGISLPAPAPEITFDEPLRILQLDPRASVELKGKLLLPARLEHYTLHFSPQALINNHPIPQGVIEQVIAVFSPSFSSRVRFAQPPAYVEPNQKIPVEVSWNNGGAIAVRNARVRLSFTPAIVDLRATARENNLKIDGGALIADSAVRTKLGTVAPGAGDSFSITIQLVPQFSLTEDSGTSLIIKPTMEATLPEVPGDVFSESGQTAAVPLATDLKFDTQTRYYTAEGDQLGRGPLPPAVGETTKYWIFARLANSTNPVRAAAFRTALQPGVEFTGKQSVTIGPPLRYDAASKTVSWEYAELPAYSQTGLYFEVAVTPAPEQIGKIISLTAPLSFTAADSVVGKEFNLIKPGLTNVLPTDDRGASSEAQVVSQ